MAATRDSIITNVLTMIGDPDQIRWDAPALTLSLSQALDTLNARLSTTYTITDLDAATETTLPADLTYLLTTGAALNALTQTPNHEPPPTALPFISAWEKGLTLAATHTLRAASTPPYANWEA